MGSKASPLNPDTVLSEIAKICCDYEIDMATTDQHAFDALSAIAERYNLTLRTEPITAKNRLEMVERARVYISQGLLELPPDPVLRNDLVQAKRRVTINGVTLVLPRQGDGRHCDYVSALGLLMVQPPDPPDAPEQVLDADFERAKALVDRGGSDFWERTLLRFGS